MNITKPLKLLRTLENVKALNCFVKNLEGNTEGPTYP